MTRLEAHRGCLIDLILLGGLHTLEAGIMLPAVLYYVNFQTKSSLPLPPFDQVIPYFFALNLGLGVTNYFAVKLIDHFIINRSFNKNS